MIRSVSAGGTGLNGLPPKRQQQPEVPFPKINTGDTAVDHKPLLSGSGEKSLMVGVKPKTHLQSILDETSGVVRLNADGDRLEVSKVAIKKAKEYFDY